MIDRSAERRCTVERPGREDRRAVRIDIRDLGLVPVADAELIADLVDDLRGHRGDPIQLLAESKPVVSLVVAMSLRPHAEDRVGVGEAM